MARFRKVASGWVNEKGVITLKLVSDLSDFVFNKSDKVVLFPNRKKISDKSGF